MYAFAANKKLSYKRSASSFDEGRLAFVLPLPLAIYVKIILAIIMAPVCY